MRALAIDEAVSQGKDPGPLAGLPIVVKDNLCVRGMITTCGSKILENWRPPYTATAVERAEAAGAIVIGKSNLDEFGMGSSTENSAFGVTRNPLDYSRVPGGSSGGSAAAVAAGYTTLSLGSDTGGSVRQPAALCGVVGVKPTYGRISRYGLVAYASSLDTVGLFANNVGDAALFYDAIAGWDARDSTSLDISAEPVSPTLDRDLGPIKVGLVKDMMDAIGEPEIGHAVRNAAQELAALGADIVEVSVPMSVRCLPAYYLLACSEASSNLARYDGVRYGLRVDGPDVEAMQTRTRSVGFGPEVKRRILLGTFALSAGYQDRYYVKSQQVRTLVIQAYKDVFSSVDVLLAPVTPTTAFKFGEREDPYSMYQFDVCTISVNLAGLPALSVPFGVGAGSMPIGLQIIGPALGEALCFRVARAIECAAVGAE